MDSGEDNGDGDDSDGDDDIDGDDIDGDDDSDGDSDDDIDGDGDDMCDGVMMCDRYTPQISWSKPAKGSGPIITSLRLILYRSRPASHNSVKFGTSSSLFLYIHLILFQTHNRERLYLLSSLHQRWMSWQLSFRSASLSPIYGQRLMYTRFILNRN